MKKVPVAVQSGQVIWKSVFAVNFAVSLLIFYPFFRLFLIRKKDYAVAFRFVKIWAWWLFLFGGIIPSVRRENTDAARSCAKLYCSNHTSFLDIMYAYIIIPEYFVAMAKIELTKIPLFCIIVKRLNITFERRNPREAVRAFVKAGEYLDSGVSVFLFPEGTISKRAPVMNEFKDGVFILAIKKQIPITPITFINNWQLLKNGDFIKAVGRPGLAKAVVHLPIETKGMSMDDVPRLKNMVSEVINNELNRYYKTCNLS